MAIVEFPPVESADEDGLLAIGGDLEPKSLLLAYSQGIFPWPINDGILAWFTPPMRAVIFLDEFHVSRSTKRALRAAHFSTKVDSAFEAVITHCAELKNRGEQNATWITTEMCRAYIDLHHLGIAHSFETYFDDELVGGIYGIQLGRFFAAESSFYRVDNASKQAMVTLAEYLRQQGISWFDCQVITPFSEAFGAREIRRAEFMELLSESQRER